MYWQAELEVIRVWWLVWPLAAGYFYPRCLISGRTSSITIFSAAALPSAVFQSVHQVGHTFRFAADQGYAAP